MFATTNLTKVAKFISFLKKIKFRKDYVVLKKSVVSYFIYLYYLYIDLLKEIYIYTMVQVFSKCIFQYNYFLD